MVPQDRKIISNPTGRWQQEFSTRQRQHNQHSSSSPYHTSQSIIQRKDEATDVHSFEKDSTGFPNHIRILVLMGHPNDEESPVRKGNNSSNAAIPSASVSGASAPSSSPPLFQSQSLPVAPSPYHHNQQWHPTVYEPEESMDGMRATTLVGLGGLIGWTAAAAYRWLNGGEFSMFPPPPTRIETENPSERIANSTNREFNHVLSSTSGPQNDFRTDWSNHNGHHHHHPQGDTVVPREHSNEAALTKQVQTLVEALEKQSIEHREIVKRLSQQSDARQTNESMQRLRAEQASQSINDSLTTVNLTLFCKLAEIQAELSSLRRDVQSVPQAADKWNERLSTTLEQVDTCLIELKKSEDGPDTTVDKTPVRTKFTWPPETTEDDGAQDAPDKSSRETGTHAVASALRRLILENDATTVRVCAQMLYLYTINLANEPGIPRYRKIFTSNESFERVDKLKGGRELLRAVGFQDRDDVLEWEPGDDEERYLCLLNEVSTALGILKSPGEATPAELLEKSLACLSLTVGTPAPRNEMEDGEPVVDDLPAMYKTPDPSILSPPATKKHVMPAEDDSPAVVGFSPPGTYVDNASTASIADSSFFADTNSRDGQITIEGMAGADSVWK